MFIKNNDVQNYDANRFYMTELRHTSEFDL